MNVEGEAGPIASVLRPVLDTYMDAAVAVVGCHATGISRGSCELDVVLVTNEARPYAAVRFGDRFFDLYFITQKEALKPANPEVAMSLAHSRPVRDASLVLSTSLASNQAVVNDNARKCSRLRLTSCLKALARTDESLSQDRVRAANYWLLSASYDFAYAWLYGQEVVPSPSHLLRQLKDHSKGGFLNFEAFSKGAGLGRSSRRECEVRLEGVSVLYDLVNTMQAENYDPGFSISQVGFEIVKKKAEHMAQMMEHAESYSFLGNEVTRALIAASRTKRGGAGRPERAAGVTYLLSERGQGLLGDKLVRDLGLERSKGDVKEALAAIRGRVAKLARENLTRSWPLAASRANAEVGRHTCQPAPCLLDLNPPGPRRHEKASQVGVSVKLIQWQKRFQTVDGSCRAWRRKTSS